MVGAVVARSSVRVCDGATAEPQQMASPRACLLPRTPMRTTFKLTLASSVHYAQRDLDTL